MAGTGFKTNFKWMKLDLVQYRRVMLNHLRSLNEKAGQAWIRAAVDETPIPTWSGASRATFQRLASELGTSVPLGPIRSKTNRVALGKASSAGSGVFEKEYEVGFTYETHLQYLVYNEYNAAVQGPPPQPYSNRVRFTPYHFQPRAESAWRAVAETAKLPNPYRYLKTGPI